MTIDKENLEALRAEARLELARRRLLDFCAVTYPKFQSPKHIQYLADLLEKVEDGTVPRIAISAPPGHGKSTLLQCFTAYFLARQPRRRVLAISANERLAKRIAVTRNLSYDPLTGRGLMSRCGTIPCLSGR